jgi:hypothetical protein
MAGRESVVRLGSPGGFQVASTMSVTVAGCESMLTVSSQLYVSPTSRGGVGRLQVPWRFSDVVTTPLTTSFSAVITIPSTLPVFWITRK